MFQQRAIIFNTCILQSVKNISVYFKTLKPAIIAIVNEPALIYIKLAWQLHVQQWEIMAQELRLWGDGEVGR